jgi:hypothetical protein
MMGPWRAIAATPVVHLGRPGLRLTGTMDVATRMRAGDTQAGDPL